MYNKIDFDNCTSYSDCINILIYIVNMKAKVSVPIAMAIIHNYGQHCNAAAS